MDRAEAEAIVERHLNQGVHNPDEALVVVPGATVGKPYGWVAFAQSRAFLETGEQSAMLVGVGPIVVLHDGSVHILGSARPPEEELYTFEVDRGLVDERGTPSRATVPPPEVPGRVPVWLGAQEGDRFPLLAVTDAGLVSAHLRHTEVEDLLEHGPGHLSHLRTTVIPLAGVEQIRTHGDTGLQVERRDDVNLAVRFATPAQRDEAFAGLHRLLAPHAPLEQLRRPRRQFLEVGGISLLLLAVGLAVPWMVETGQIDRAHWLIATVFNALGLTGFRVLGVVLAAACLVGLVVIIINNPPRAGFRVGPPPLSG